MRNHNGKLKTPASLQLQLQNPLIVLGERGKKDLNKSGNERNGGMLHSAVNPYRCSSVVGGSLPNLTPHSEYPSPLCSSGDRRMGWGC